MDSTTRQRGLWLAGTAAVAVALAGFFTGIRRPAAPDFSRAADAKGDAEAAVDYRGLRGEARGPNRVLYDRAFAHLRAAGPGVMDPVEQSPEDREAALEARRDRRAYAGAPPVVPHPIQERNPAACLSCHRDGARVAGLRAPPMSHEPYTMCVQCHAPSRTPTGFEVKLPDIPPENEFVGLGEPGHGEQAWEGAPPTIPHPTFMREQCSSCHGPQGAHGIRTPHPYQQACKQCHAPAGEFDQNRPPAAGLPPIGR